jgi:putative ABC transport system permease protein
MDPRDPSRRRSGLRVGLLTTLLADAFAELKAHRRSHALTLLGIVWGAAAVVFLMSAGVAFNQFLDVGFEKTGDRWTVVNDAFTTSETDGAKPGRAIHFEREDLALVRAGVPSACAVAAGVHHHAIARTPLITRPTFMSGTNAAAARIENQRLARGRWFTEEEDRQGRAVVVLGHDLEGTFFGSESAIGRTIHLDGRPFEVIGVLERKGFQIVTIGELHDATLFVPLTLGADLAGMGRSIGHIFVEPCDISAGDALRAEVRAALAGRHHLAPDDDEAIEFTSIPEITAPIRRIGAGLVVLLGLVGTVTLAIAGVGVGNLMVAIVNARRHEFAVRRACGARRRDVMLQLLVETTVVVSAGGLIGLCIGTSGVALLRVLPRPDMIPAPEIVPMVMITTILVMVGVGLVAGLLPGRIASGVEPSEALRVT